MPERGSRPPKPSPERTCLVVAQCLKALRAGQDDLTGNPSKFKLFALIPGATTPPGRPPHSMSTPGSLCRWLSPLPHPTPPLGPPVRLPTAPLLAFHLVPRQPATVLSSIPHQPAPQTASPGLRPHSRWRLGSLTVSHIPTPRDLLPLSFTPGLLTPGATMTSGGTDIARDSRHCQG